MRRPWGVCACVCFVALFGSISAAEPPAASAPATVAALWEDFDPRKDELSPRVVREWERDGLVFRYVTYRIGTFKDRPAVMAGYYAFPKGARALPGLLHLHGGGQRAFLDEVEYYARRGYACLSINWGGREMEDARPGEPNTDWGAVDPTQNNVPGYSNLLPGEKTVDAFESPRNNNWYLLTLGARRGVTFLERQPEVDPDRLGVYGHSMGGNLTVYVAGSDARVKAAAPSVGGSGFRTDPWPLLPEATKQQPRGSVELFRNTLGFEAYAPRIRAPLLWLGSTNDFHGIMDDTYRTGALIPRQDGVRYVFAPHLNHRFTPETAIARPLWFEQHLKGKFVFPAEPDARLILSAADGIPELRVVPDPAREAVETRVYWSLDPDPRARYWRSADVVATGATRTAKLPILSLDRPLFAYADVFYRLEKAEPVLHAGRTDRVALSSQLRTATPADLRTAGVRATDGPSDLIDDFAHGFRDWYVLSGDNPHHWEYSTRKLSDPKWRLGPGERLEIEVQADRPNELTIVLTENFFRSYRGQERTYAAVVKLTGGSTPQIVVLSPADFRTADGTHPTGWSEIDVLSLRAYADLGGRTLGSKSWAGKQPKFTRLRRLPADR